jgi:hypothetical protein
MIILVFLHRLNIIFLKKTLLVHGRDTRWLVEGTRTLITTHVTL